MTEQQDSVAAMAPALSNSEMDELLAQSAARSGEEKKPFKIGALESDAESSLLSPRQRRKLQLHHEGFAAELSSRLTQFLRTDFTVSLAGIQTVSYKRMTESWPEPAHLTLFKTEPLRGVSILEIPIGLALCIVDRLMGGPGQASDISREMSAIENTLLEQVAQMAALEWCRRGAVHKELKPVVLGHENSARFLQTAPPNATMLVVVLDAVLGSCREKIQMAFPFATLEPLIRQLSQNTETEVDQSPAPAAPLPRAWNSCFDDVCIPVTAEWQSLELAAREVLHLKVGDVLRIDPASCDRVKVRLGDDAKFHGRLGAIAGKWAVELTERVKH